MILVSAKFDRLLWFVLLGIFPLAAQTPTTLPKFYLGASYGTSFSLGDFEDTDIQNPDAGFARNGDKLDIFGGFFLNERVTFTGLLRYQTFDTDIDNVIRSFNENEDNPGVTFTGSTEDWKVYYLLLGLGYRVNISKTFSFTPRFGIGPMWVTTPGLSVSATEGTSSQNFSRSSETGVGLGYELGIGLRSDLGKHFSLMPTFTFSGGWATINDVVTTTNGVFITRDYQPGVESFTLGLSLAYRFY